MVFFLGKKTGKHGVRDRRRHLGRARKLVWGEWQRDGDWGGGGNERKIACSKTCLLRVAGFDFVRRRTRHFDWSIYCQPSSVWSHAEKKQISETENVGEAIERALDFLNRKIETLFWSLSKSKLWAVYKKVKMSWLFCLLAFEKAWFLRSSESQRGRAAVHRLCW